MKGDTLGRATIIGGTIVVLAVILAVVVIWWRRRDTQHTVVKGDLNRQEEQRLMRMLSDADNLLTEIIDTTDVTQTNMDKVTIMDEKLKAKIRHWQSLNN